jgi:hypothetical protein
MRKVVAAALLTLAFPNLATAGPIIGSCWTAPQPQTVQEALVVAQNEANVAARHSPTGSSAMLALSDGRLKAAYGAGLIVGWGETGSRPEFAVVTAVGTSALLAPLAFIGRGGDSAIADLFACEAGSLQEMAEHAARLMTDAMVEQIALRHESGARLLIALPGSAARRETVWDIGAIAASQHPAAKELIATVLRAAVDLTTFVDPKSAPIPAGLTAVRNPALRRLGAGEAFLAAPNFRTSPEATYLIHNGVLFADESEEYAAAQALRGDEQSPPRANIWLLPAYDLFIAAERQKAPLRIASPRPNLNLQPAQSAFDPTYMRGLFLHAYRQGRMRREWRATFVAPAGQ